MSEPGELNCDQVVELVTEYLDGALTPEVAGAFETHLAECDDCATYIDQIKDTARRVKSVRAQHLPEETRAGLLAAFRDVHRAG